MNPAFPEYIFGFTFKGTRYLYNSYNHALARLSNPDIGVDDTELLKKRGFFDNFDRVKKEFMTHREDSLYIGIQPTLRCNFRCDYCYQTHREIDLDSSVFKKLQRYLESVFSERRYSRLKVGIVGGEPTISDIPLNIIIERIDEMANQLSVRADYYIYTNGYESLPLMDLKTSHPIQLFITITNPQEHNNRRITIAGKPTFDKIIENINRLHESNPNLDFVIRYNVSAGNMDEFDGFLDLLLDKLIFKPKITIVPLTSTRWYETDLSTSKFLRWTCKTAIPSIRAHELEPVFGYSTTAHRCKAYSSDSIDIRANGSLGRCVSDTSPVASESELHSLSRESTELENYPCRSCRFLFICGGRKLCRTGCDYTRRLNDLLMMLDYVENEKSCEGITFVKDAGKSIIIYSASARLDD